MNLKGLLGSTKNENPYYRYSKEGSSFKVPVAKDDEDKLKTPQTTSTGYGKLEKPILPIKGRGLAGGLGGR